MGSSGISSINPVRPVDAPIGNNVRNSDVDFGAIMSQQTLSAGAELGENHYTGQSIRNTKTLINTAPKTENRVKNVSENVSGNKTDKAVMSDESPEKVSEVSDKVKEAVEDIKDKIKEEFGVTDEDIEKALEVLGITMADLLDESKLTDFVVELTGMENAVELLVTPEVSGQLADISDFIQETMAELSEELDIPKEELDDLLKKVITEMEQPARETSGLESSIASDEVLSAETDRSDRNNKNGIEQLKQKTDTADVRQDNEITVRVEKPQNSGTAEHNHSELDKGDSTQHMVNQMVDNFTNAVNEAFQMQGLDEGIHAVQIIEQIVEAAKVTLNQEITTMELMLNPESLGKINMTVSVKEGVVTASLVAQNEAAKEAIESQIVMLKENLNNQGIKVEAVEVTVESHAFEANTNHGQNNGFNEQREQAQKKSSRPLRLDSLEELDMEELTEEERIVMDMMVNDGNQVNFTA